MIATVVLHQAMSKVSQPQEEQITQHPLEAVAKELESLLEKLRMELDIAPTDRMAHQDLLRRIIQASETGLQISAQQYPTSPSLPEGETQELTEEELELLNSVEWITVVEEGQDIDDEALDNWLRQRGYKV